jgi:NAD(P)-dependent dehydrogenase (short-subunit alcohol dehydrogenase family)
MNAPAIPMIQDNEGKIPAHVSPMRRTGHPDEIASLILTLASAEGAYCNGSVFLSDGGRLANGPTVF